MCVCVGVYFYTIPNVRHTQLGAAVCSFLSYGSLAECFCRSTMVDSDFDLNTGAIQRHNLLCASEHKCFPPVVTKQHTPIYSRYSSGKLTVRAWPHAQNTFGWVP